MRESFRQWPLIQSSKYRTIENDPIVPTPSFSNVETQDFASQVLNDGASVLVNALTSSEQPCERGWQRLEAASAIVPLRMGTLWSLRAECSG